MPRVGCFQERASTIWVHVEVLRRNFRVGRCVGLMSFSIGWASWCEISVKWWRSVHFDEVIGQHGRTVGFVRLACLIRSDPWNFGGSSLWLANQILISFSCWWWKCDWIVGGTGLIGFVWSPTLKSINSWAESNIWLRRYWCYENVSSFGWKTILPRRTRSVCERACGSRVVRSRVGYRLWR